MDWRQERQADKQRARGHCYRQEHRNWKQP